MNSGFLNENIRVLSRVLPLPHYKHNYIKKLYKLISNEIEEKVDGHDKKNFFKSNENQR